MSAIRCPGSRSRSRRYWPQLQQYVTERVRPPPPRIAGRPVKERRPARRRRSCLPLPRPPPTGRSDRTLGDLLTLRQGPALRCVRCCGLPSGARGEPHDSVPRAARVRRSLAADSAASRLASRASSSAPARLSARARRGRWPCAAAAATGRRPPGGRRPNPAVHASSATEWRAVAQAVSPIERRAASSSSRTWASRAHSITRRSVA